MTTPDNPRHSPRSRILRTGAFVVGMFLLSIVAYWGKCRVGVNLSEKHHLSGIEPYRTVWRLAERHWPF